MTHLKKYILAYALLVAAGILSAGLIYTVYSPSPVTGNFSKNAASQDLIPFDLIQRAKILEVLQTEENQNEHFSSLTQSLKVKLLEGPGENTEILADYNENFTSKDQKLEIGDKIVVAKMQNAGEEGYVVIDRYRLPALWWALAAFLAIALTFAKLKGFSSALGLLFSLAILLFFVAPNLLAGKNPLLVSGVGAGFIALVSIFLAHGFNKRAMLSTVSTLLTLLVTIVLTVIFSKTALLFGRGTDEAFYLQAGFFGIFNLQGLLLGGIIIGTMGVLDDVTTTQTAAVDEISKADPALNFYSLYKRGLSVGQEHIASLVNTLVLAYAGASLPLFLLFTTNTNQPLWALLNSEYLAEEIVRTLVGSISLVLAVPISTLLSAKYFSGKNIS